MDKNELITELQDRFHAVDTERIHQGDTIAGITTWDIRVFDKIGDVLRRLTLTFFTEIVDSVEVAYWGNQEPKPPSSEPVLNFHQRVNNFIKSKIDDGVIKFGYVEQILDVSKKALGTAIMASDNSTKQVIITENPENPKEPFSIEVI